uniref:Aquaporin NIP6-1-like n=1 Tax=Bursaphelenchus xylophilus TaxID=6326 RepID=A0A1I7S2V5_BURXY
MTSSTKRVPRVPTYSPDKVVCFKVPANTEVTEKNLKPGYSNASKLAAEFLGCIVFIFVGSLSGLQTMPANRAIRVALAHGFANFVLACAFGHIR